MTVYLFPSNLVAFYFSCQTDVPKTSKTMLNKSGKNGPPFLVPEFRGKAFSFHHWLWGWLWVCHKWSLLCWDMLPLYPIRWKAFFFLSWMDVVSKDFVAFVEMIMWYLFFLLLMWCITLICECWIMFVTLELDHGVWSFQYIAAFSLLILCSAFLHL